MSTSGNVAIRQVQAPPRPAARKVLIRPSPSMKAPLAKLPETSRRESIPRANPFPLADAPITESRRFASTAFDWRLPVACAACVAVALLVAIPPRIAAGGYLNHVSGAWATLADDVAHGILYRPLTSSLGYGGTRYFPLHFVLHGLLSHLGLSLRVAGHILSLGSAVVLVAGGAMALSKRGASPPLAWSAGLLALGSRTAFMAVAGIRGDLLPLALGVLGLALVPDRRSRQASVLPSALVLGAALLAKPTLVWAPAGALLALAVERRFRKAVELGATTLAFVGSGMLVAFWASHGEILTSLRACASGGGFSLSTLLGNLSYVRPGDLAWALGGVALTLTRGRKGISDPLCAGGLVALPVTVALHASKGIHVNVLIDTVALGALALGAAWADARSRRPLKRLVLIGATILGVAEALVLDGMFIAPGELEQAVASLPAGPGPVLSEQPWIPLLAGERPFLLDAFSVAQTRKSTPSVDRDLLDRLDHCRFKSVVLLGRADKVPWQYDENMGPGFTDHLLASYFLDRIAGAHAFYLPRCGSTGALAPPRNAGAETVVDRGTRPSRIDRVRAWIDSLRR
jgi:hypothetical protein